MSESDNNLSPKNCYLSDILDLEDEIKHLKSELKYKDYQMSWMLAEICMLNDTMTKMRDTSSDVVKEIQSMNEMAELALITGQYLKWDGSEITYKGENSSKIDPDRQKKEAIKKRERDSAYKDYKIAAAENSNLFKFSKQSKAQLYSCILVVLSSC